jgi:alpha-tubulin suppressor-like RCC1 family protein
MIKGIILSLFIVVAFAFAMTPNAKPYFVGLHIIKPACSEYVNTYLYSDSNIYAYVFTGTVKFQPFNFSGNKIVSVAPGFNQFIALDASGFVWTADLGSLNAVKKTVDTFGNSFNSNREVYGYFFSYFTISTDSTKIFTWGNGSYNWFSTPIVKPYLLHAPAGKKFVKLAAGNDLLALTSTGEIIKWANGDTNYVTMTIPAGSFAVDIGASHNAFYTAIIHDYSGGSASLGKIYGWGSNQGFLGDNQSRTQPFPMAGIFKTTTGAALPFSAKSIVCHDNTVLFTDSINDLYSEGDFAQGEGGNGRDTVLKYQYSNQYAWTTLKGEAYTNGTCYKILSNVKYIPYGTSFTFYAMAVDMNDSLWFWGRNKSFVLPTSYVSNTESTKPNALDMVLPTLGSGFQHPNGVSVNFVAPTMSAGGNQSVTTNNPTLSVSGNPTQMGGYGYSFFSYQWSQVSGATAVINSPTSSTTTVTMPSAGTYRFRMTTTDTQTATDTASVQIIYNPPAGGCGGCSVQNRIRGFKRI